MTSTSVRAFALFLVTASTGGFSSARAQQVTLVNMVPNARSGETIQDSEPSLAVNPGNPQQLVGSAFTWDNLNGGPMTGALAPIYVSTNGGITWSTVNNVPSVAGSTFPTGDIMLRFSNRTVGTTNTLYGGILRATGFNMAILRTADYRTTTPMAVIDTRTNNVDQPHVRAGTVLGGAGAGRDRLYVGFNNGYGGVASQTATVDFSLDASVVSPAFNLQLLETRSTGTAGQDGFANVPAIHPDGTVYMLFYGWRSTSGIITTSDIIVCRDDNWGSGATPFAILTDPSDSLAGRKVVTGQRVVRAGNIGQQRLGASNLAIAVDPRNSDRVYIAWAEQPSGTANQTLHMRRSTDRGVTWSAADLVTVANAVNPQVAINSLGQVAFLYQALVGTPSRWQSTVRRTTNPDATVFDSPGILLANTPATTPARVFQPYIGDYTGLIAYGKDFYGAFSANNTPNTANFFAGVVYQRFANWTTNTLFADAAMTTTVPASIDPFFFRIRALPAENDFYVRDWTDSPTSGDDGLEPSTHGVFYLTSDVWNRRGTLPGGFPGGQPDNEDAGNGAGTVGDNWAFARIRRNALPASGTKAVTAHFLVSKLGTGSNYVDASSGDPDVTFLDPDPTVTFNATDLGPLITTPVKWHLDAVSTTHLCLAVEINSPPDDPVIPPSLLGRSPGWPATDLGVLNDNNKAQRNMGLSTTPARGAGASVCLLAIAHNAATSPRDMALVVNADERVRPLLERARIEVVGDKTRSFRPGETIVLPRMMPGENRWVGVTFPAPAGEEGDEIVIRFDEIVNGAAVNGFALGVRLASTERAARDVLESHRSLLSRVLALYPSNVAKREADAVTTFLAENRRVDRGDYLGFVRAHMGDSFESTQPILAAPESFGIEQWQRKLKASIKKGDPAAVIVAHASWLNRLDSLITMRQLAKGDPADILQTVRWQDDLFRRVPELQRLACSREMHAAASAFIRGVGERRTGYDEYPRLVEKLLGCMQEAVDNVGQTLPGLDRDLEAIKLAGNVLARLQHAHAGFLAKLQSLEKGR